MTLPTNFSAEITPSVALQKKKPSFLSSDCVASPICAFIFSRNDHQSYFCVAPSIAHLISCPYFKVKRIKVRGTIRLKSDESSFHFVSVLKVYGILNTSEHILQAKKTDGFFITAVNLS